MNGELLSVTDACLRGNSWTSCNKYHISGTSWLCVLFVNAAMTSFILIVAVGHPRIDAVEDAVRKCVKFCGNASLLIWRRMRSPQEKTLEHSAKRAVSVVHRDYALIEFKLNWPCSSWPWRQYIQGSTLWSLLVEDVQRFVSMQLLFLRTARHAKSACKALCWSWTLIIYDTSDRRS